VSSAQSHNGQVHHVLFENVGSDRKDPDAISRDKRKYGKRGCYFSMLRH
jgi:hypothetical protein